MATDCTHSQGRIGEPRRISSARRMPSRLGGSAKLTAAERPTLHRRRGREAGGACPWPVSQARRRGERTRQRPRTGRRGDGGRERRGARRPGLDDDEDVLVVVYRVPSERQRGVRAGGTHESMMTGLPGVPGMYGGGRGGVSGGVSSLSLSAAGGREGRTPETTPARGWASHKAWAWARKAPG